MGKVGNPKGQTREASARREQYILLQWQKGVHAVDIAQSLGITPDAVWKRVQRALRKAVPSVHAVADKLYFDALALYEQLLGELRMEKDKDERRRLHVMMESNRKFIVSFLPKDHVVSETAIEKLVERSKEPAYYDDGAKVLPA